MKKDRIFEVINCKECGETFASCWDGYQDSDWNKSRSEYLQFGHTVKFVNREEFSFGNCKCPKTSKEISEKAQLKLDLK